MSKSPSKKQTRDKKNAPKVQKASSRISRPDRRNRVPEMIVWFGDDVYECSSLTKVGAYYQVVVDARGKITCQCADYAKHRGRDCKHGSAVRFVHNQYSNEQRALWAIPFEVPMTRKQQSVILASKQFYARNVRRRQIPDVRYDDGRSIQHHIAEARPIVETRQFEVLEDLLSYMQSGDEIQVRVRGRPPRDVYGRAAAVLFKVSQRASLSTVCQRLDKPVIQRLVGTTLGKGTLCEYFADESVRAVLEEALRVMAHMVRLITRIVNVDSSGFPRSAQANYRNDEFGREPIRPYATYLRGHVASCAATNMIVGLSVTFSYGPESSDHSQFERLVRVAKTIWNFKYVAADKAYFSDEHLFICDNLGAQFVCPPKSGWVPSNSKHRLLADRINDLYYHRRDEFNEIYSWRGKAESVFSTIEQILGKSLWTRGSYKMRDPNQVPCAIVVELLAKCVVQNLRRLVFLEKTLGQEVSFTSGRLLRPFEKARVLSGRTLLAEEAA